MGEFKSEHAGTLMGQEPDAIFITTEPTPLPCQRDASTTGAVSKPYTILILTRTFLCNRIEPWLIDASCFLFVQINYPNCFFLGVRISGNEASASEHTSHLLPEFFFIRGRETYSVLLDQPLSKTGQTAFSPALSDHS